jgi:hypothetical protein
MVAAATRVVVEAPPDPGSPAAMPTQDQVRELLDRGHSYGMIARDPKYTVEPQRARLRERAAAAAGLGSGGLSLTASAAPAAARREPSA